MPYAAPPKAPVLRPAQHFASLKAPRVAGRTEHPNNRRDGPRGRAQRRRRLGRPRRDRARPRGMVHAPGRDAERGAERGRLSARTERAAAVGLCGLRELVGAKKPGRAAERAGRGLRRQDDPRRAQAHALERVPAPGPRLELQTALAARAKGRRRRARGERRRAEAARAGRAARRHRDGRRGALLARHRPGHSRRRWRLPAAPEGESWPRTTRPSPRSSPRRGPPASGRGRGFVRAQQTYCSSARARAGCRAW